MVAIERADAWAGEAIDAIVRHHHRRRLRRTGQLMRLEPPSDGALWAAGAPAPRPGCELEVLVDGEQALRTLAEALAAARDHVHLAGWHLSPDFRLTRDGATPPLRDLLAELATTIDVRILLWAGAPVPVFKPRRRDMRRVRDELTRGTRVRCALDPKERPMHCHHEKVVVVDGEVAFVGGIDLSSLAGDRWDTSSHPARGRLGWHDAATRLRGPAVADVAHHVETRWHEVTGERLTPTVAGLPAGDVEVQVVRTVPEHVYDALPHGDFRILESYVRALRSAETLIYLENQFLWSPEIVAILEDKLRRPPTDAFRLVLLLPAKPNDGADDTRGQLGLLASVDVDGRMLATTVSARTGARTEVVYVHAKVGVVDDRWLTLGSANLNEHSLFNDTEMNVVTCDPRLARETRLRLWAEHLECPVDEIAEDPTRVIDERWAPIARDQRRRVERGEPRTHRLIELSQQSRRLMAAVGPLQGFLVDG